jgi:hypothetical protein
MARRESRTSDLPRVFEGREVLSVLLARAGSTLDAAACEATFAKAAREGRIPSEVFPTLFPREPRFASPEEARRLYGNLFGLWDLVASGGTVPTSQPRTIAVREPAPKPSRREGELVDEGFVEAAWRYLADLPERETTRMRDRYEETQPQLAEFVREESPPSDAGSDTADAIAFELWAMDELAFGPAPRRISFARLQQLQSFTAQPAQTALLSYVNEALTEAELDEDEPITTDERRAIEALARTMLLAFEELRKPAGS